MIICRDSYGGEIKFGKTTVKFEESDLNNPNIAIGFGFEYLIVPKYLEEEFKKSYLCKSVVPTILARCGEVEYKDFNGRFRNHKIDLLLS